MKCSSLGKFIPTLIFLNYRLKFKKTKYYQAFAHTDHILDHQNSFTFPLPSRIPHLLGFKNSPAYYLASPTYLDFIII